jgi:hypothetical protein
MHAPLPKTPRDAAIDTDESRWPLVVITFRGVPTDEEFEAYLEGQTRIVQRRERFASLVDARQAGQMPPVQRRIQAEWMQQHHDALRSFALGVSFAIESPIVRGVLTAILWLAPLPQPYYIAATMEDAERWAVGRLRAAGLAAPVSGWRVRKL